MSMLTAEQSSGANIYIGPKTSAIPMAYYDSPEICPGDTQSYDESTNTLRSFYLTEEKYCKNNEKEKEVLENESIIEQEVLEESEDDSSGNDEYGEPIREQHLAIDFTPTDNIDDSDYNVQKCIEFWQFLKKHPELQHLKVTPNVVFEGSEQTDAWSSTTSRVSSSSTHSAIQWAMKNNLMHTALITKHPKTYCEDRGRVSWKSSRTGDILEDVKPEKTLDAKAMKTKKGVDSMPGHSAHRVRRIMADMKMWDRKNPRSNDPPGHPPTLNTAKMVRDGRFYWDQAAL